MSSFHVQTLANSIIGTAILAMPYCFSKCGVILSILLLIISTIITRSCCHYLIKASIVTRRRKMEQLGFHMFGTAGKTMVEISVIGFLMGTCIAFFVVIGDLSPLIIAKIFNVQQFSHDSVRKFLIILITLTCVIPLSFQKSIESLSFVCRASIGFYICLTLKTVFESFERFESDSNWASNIDLWKPSGILQCIPIFSMAMSCQMQLFEVYETMGFSGSFDRIKKTVHQATSICCIVYCVVGFFGYLAFYNETLSGNILMNFRPSLANDAITIGFILSIACSFPLVIFPCRTALASFLHRKSHHSEIASYVPESKYKPLTLFIIFSTMILGILIPSVEVIISLVGSTIGVLVCILFPATCFVKIMQRSSAEKTFAQMIIVFGFIIMILGTYANLNAIDLAKSGSHLEEKPSIIENIVEHPKENNREANIKPIEPEHENPKVIKEIDDTILHTNEKEIQKEVKVSADGIKKEEEVIADEKTLVLKDPRVEIQEKNEEIQELKESKDKLEKEVLEMKEELVKQNKETQQLVLQKFGEIAEKVEKIEKQSLDGPSAKEKQPLVEQFKLEEQKPVLKQPILRASHEVSNVSETEVVKKISNESNIEIAKEPEVVLASGRKHENLNDLEKLEIKDKPKDDLKPVEPIPKGDDQVKKLDDLTASKSASPEKPSDPENREDPIVKLIKSQEPLSYQVGEKMMQTRNSNASIAEHVKLPELPRHDLADDEIKNEMRKKRETIEDALSSLDKTVQSIELKSIINRDLKATSDDE